MSGCTWKLYSFNEWNLDETWKCPCKGDNFLSFLPPREMDFCPYCGESLSYDNDTRQTSQQKSEDGLSTKHRPPITGE